jgi:hypothetical protein
MKTEKEHQLNLMKDWQKTYPDTKIEMKGIWVCINIGHDFITRRYHDLAMKIIPVFL